MIRVKKIWSWVKNYWYIPVLLVLGIAFFIMSGGNNRNLFGIIGNAMDSHKKEVNAIEKAHQEEIDKRDKALKLYHIAVAQIEEKFKERQEELDDKKKKEIKKIIEENQDDPEELAKRISESTGFPIVMPEE